jgi:transposase
MGKLSAEDRELVISSVRDKGRSVSAAAREYGVSRKTARKWVKEAEEGRDDLNDLPRSGRSPILNQKDKNYVRRVADRALSVKGIVKRVGMLRGKVVSPRTVGRTLHSGKVPRGYLPPKHEYFISHRNACKRVEFCREFMLEEKRQYVCIDAVLLRYSYVSGKATRLHWQRLDRRDVERKAQKPSYVLVYGGIAYGQKSPLFQVGTSHTKVLVPDSGDFCSAALQLKEWISTLPKRRLPYKFFLDNASCHTSKETTAYLNRMGAKARFNVPQSPDLNLVENAWSLLHNQLDQMKHKSFEHFIQNIHKAWDKVDTGIVTKMFDGWSARCQRVIDSDGRKPVA